MDSPIIDAVQAVGATAFARLLRLSNDISSTLTDSNILFGIVPSDNAIRSLLTRFERPANDLVRIPAFRQLVLNHFSTTMDFKVPTINMLSGYQLDLDRASLDKRKIMGKLAIDGRYFLLIDTIIGTAEQVQSLFVKRDAGIFGNLDARTFNLLVQQGNLKGMDLIGLCLTNEKLNSLCNQRDQNGETIFHRLLKTDFNIEVTKEADARATYITRNERKPTFFVKVDRGGDKVIQLSDKSQVQLKRLSDYYKQVITPGNRGKQQHHAVGLKYDGTVFTIDRAGVETEVQAVAGVKKLGSRIENDQVIVLLLQRNGALIRMSNLAGYSDNPIVDINDLAGRSMIMRNWWNSLGQREGVVVDMIFGYNEPYAAKVPLSNQLQLLTKCDGLLILQGPHEPAIYFPTYGAEYDKRDLVKLSQLAGKPVSHPSGFLLAARYRHLQGDYEDRKAVYITVDGGLGVYAGVSFLIDTSKIKQPIIDIGSMDISPIQEKWVTPTGVRGTVTVLAKGGAVYKIEFKVSNKENQATVTLINRIDGLVVFPAAGSVVYRIRA